MNRITALLAAAALVAVTVAPCLCASASRPGSRPCCDTGAGLGTPTLHCCGGSARTTEATVAPVPTHTVGVAPAADLTPGRSERVRLFSRSTVSAPSPPATILRI